MVLQPVVAVLLLFPVTKDSEAAKDKGEAAGPGWQRKCTRHNLP